MVHNRPTPERTHLRAPNWGCMGTSRRSLPQLVTVQPWKINIGTLGHLYYLFFLKEEINLPAHSARRSSCIGPRQRWILQHHSFVLQFMEWLAATRVSPRAATQEAAPGLFLSQPATDRLPDRTTGSPRLPLPSSHTTSLLHRTLLLPVPTPCLLAIKEGWAAERQFSEKQFCFWVSGGLLQLLVKALRVVKNVKESNSYKVSLLPLTSHQLYLISLQWY